MSPCPVNCLPRTVFAALNQVQNHVQTNLISISPSRWTGGELRLIVIPRSANKTSSQQQHHNERISTMAINNKMGYLPLPIGLLSLLLLLLLLLVGSGSVNGSSSSSSNSIVEGETEELSPGRWNLSPLGPNIPLSLSSSTSCYCRSDVLLSKVSGK